MNLSQEMVEFLKICKIVLEKYLIFSRIHHFQLSVVTLKYLPETLLKFESSSEKYCINVFGFKRDKKDQLPKTLQFNLFVIIRITFLSIWRNIFKNFSHKRKYLQIKFCSVLKCVNVYYFQSGINLNIHKQ